MRTWNLNVKISVADSWIADGFDLSKRMDELESAIKYMLPHAYDHEMTVETKLLSAPTTGTIAALQDGTMEIVD